MPRLDKGTLELSHSAAEISCAAKAAIPRECVPRLNEGTLEVSHLELRSVKAVISRGCVPWLNGDTLKVSHSVAEIS